LYHAPVQKLRPVSEFLVPGEEENPSPPPPHGEVEGKIEAARHGSAAALGQVLETCRRYLLAVANQELDPDLRAKIGPSDVVQETFLEANRDFGQFNGRTQEDLLAWLRRILLHNLANVRRQFCETDKRRIHREVPLDVALGGPVEANLIAAQATPGSELAAQEQVARMMQAMERLPEHYREVLRLRHQEGRSFEDIGARTGRSAEAARKVWARAVELLKEHLKPTHDAP
jgi:RNA polymerase sigma-70 factor (ECF subfamily)